MVLNYKYIITLKYLYEEGYNYNYLELAKHLNIHPLILNIMIKQLCKHGYLEYGNDNILKITHKGLTFFKQYKNNIIYDYKEKNKYDEDVEIIIDYNELLQNIPFNDRVLQRTINASILSRMREESHLLLGKMLLFNVFINLIVICIFLFLFYC